MVMQEKRIALTNAGKMDLLRIQDYQNLGGFIAFEKALSQDPADIIREIEDSGLRGRGGGGFPTGKKMRFTDQARCSGCVPKYVVCNADEGEPGTFKDRVIMEQDPYILIEGMMIAAYAISAAMGYIYIRGEYTASISRLQEAIKNCYHAGYLGNNIQHTGFSFDIEIKIGAGSYLCGEELTLLESLEGKRGYPRIKPPFPANAGLFNQPTLINNVETFAHIPFIIAEGAEAYKKMGTDKSPGTKIFTISGDIERPGVYETEMGITLRQLIDDMAGGIKHGKHFLAALLGGAAGTFVNASVLDTPLGFDSLKEKGAILGSGAVMIMSRDRNLFDMLYAIMEFFKHESCGKCVPCRVGTFHLVMMMDQFRWQNDLRQELLKKLQYEAEYIAENSLCPLGASPILPINSMIKYFKEQF